MSDDHEVAVVGAEKLKQLLAAVTVTIEEALVDKDLIDGDVREDLSSEEMDNLLRRSNVYYAMSGALRFAAAKLLTETPSRYRNLEQFDEHLIELLNEENVSPSASPGELAVHTVAVMVAGLHKFNNLTLDRQETYKQLLFHLDMSGLWEEVRGTSESKG